MGELSIELLLNCHVYLNHTVSFNLPEGLLKLDLPLLHLNVRGHLELGSLIFNVSIRLLNAHDMVSL